MGGFQRVPVANLFAMLNSVLSLVAVLIVVRMRGTVVDLSVAYCAAMLTGTILLNLWMALRHEPRIRPSVRKVHLGSAREIMSHGMLFFVLQIAGLAVFNTDNLIIAHFLGAEQVTPYAVTWRLVNYASLLQSLLVPSLWPAFSEAYVGHDLVWIRATYRRIMRATVFTVTFAALFLGLTGRWIIGIWAGATAVPSSALLWGMCFWVILLAITVNQAALLAAAQQIGWQAVFATLTAILNLVLSIWLVRRFGTIGVLSGTVISYLLLVVIPQTWVVRRTLRGRYLKLTVQREPVEEVSIYGI